MEIIEHDVRLIYVGETSVEGNTSDAAVGLSGSDFVGDQAVWVQAAAELVSEDDLKISKALDKASDTLIWQEGTSSLVSKDFLPAASILLRGADPERLTRYKIDAEMAREGGLIDACLSSPSSSNDVSLCLKLRQASQARLKEVSGADIEFVKLNIQPRALYRFRSGIRFLELSVSVDTESDAVLLEVVSILTRYNRLVWRNQNTGECSSEFSLGSIARFLLDGTAGVAEDRRRVFSVSCARVANASKQEDCVALATRLAKHFNGQHLIDKAADLSCKVMQPLNGTWRGTSPEGAAIIKRDDGTQFAESYIRDIFNVAYAPLGILALHEQEMWTSLSSDASRWHDVANGETLESLQRNRYRALQLRTAYSLPRISRIADHDAWKQALEHQMRTPELRSSLAEDLVQADAVLQIEASRRRDRRFRWLTIFAGSAVAGVSAFGLVTGSFQAFGKTGWQWGLDGTWEAMTSPPIALPFMALAATMIVAFALLSGKIPKD